MKKITVRWTQVYESEAEVPDFCHCSPSNWQEFADYLNFNTNVDGAEGQVGTFEVLDVGEKKIEHNYDWSPDEMAEKTGKAYSAYFFVFWLAVCKILKDRKYSEREAEAILRSKWYLDEKKICSDHPDIKNLIKALSN